MQSEFKKGSKVIVYASGENTGKFYKNVPATIVECDPYYKDYCVRFKDGTEDWILPKDLRKPYTRKIKGVKTYES